MRYLIGALGACLIAGGQAYAGTMDAFVEHGVIVEQNGAIHETRFSDGRFSSSDGATGTFTYVDGSLCMTTDGSDQARCFELPEGKDSGDSFSIELPNSTAVYITIK